MHNFCHSFFFISRANSGLPQSSLNINQLHFTRSSAVDTNDVIIIKLIVTYYCLNACSIHRYGEGVAHAWCKLKPHLLLSNRCRIEYFNLALSLLLVNQVTSAVCR